MFANHRAIVYGMITIGAVLAVESARSETFSRTLEGVAVALLMYWLAHSYSEYTQRRHDSERPMRVRGLLGTMWDELAIVIGAALPIAALLICWLAGATLVTAVRVAIWTAAATVVAYEALAGFRERLPRRDLALQTGLGMLLGVSVIALRLVLH